MPLFRDIAENHAKSDLAIYSANLLLDCMAMKKDYKNLEGTVDKFLGTPELLKDEEFAVQLKKLKANALRLRVQETEKRKLPTELALLPFVESAMQPQAVSSAQAAGLWQFMPSTGRNYSLEQNLWKDERFGVVESTRAALDYLENLYAEFGSWELALAAYNYGEAGVEIDERLGVSYPDGVQAPDGTIYLIYDFERTKQKQILMAAFTEDDVAKGKWSASSRQRVVINQASGGKRAK